LVNLNKIKSEEDNQQNEILSSIRPVHDFYVLYGRAAAKENIENMQGVWVSERCSLNLEIEDGKLKAHGNFFL
jgi:hypothetical protein